MTQTSAPWEGLLVGDAINAPYSALEWAAFWNKLHGVGSSYPNYGIVPGTGDGTYDSLQVFTSSGAVIEVKPGSALVNGQLYTSSAAEQLTVAANASGNARIDTAVLRADYTAQTIRLVLKQGTPAASPARPSLTQSASLWEIPLADVAVANGFSSIVASNITDRRRSALHTAAGWLPYAYLADYVPGNAYSASRGLSSGQAFPFSIAGNMLVDQLVILARGNSTSEVRWGIYTEKTNDNSTTPDGTVYRKGGRASTSTLSFTSGSRTDVPADSPVMLTPGMYWLIMYIPVGITVGAVDPTGDAFNANLFRNLQNSISSLPQTIDLTSGWGLSSGYDIPVAIRLEGRVLGQTTPL